MLFLDEFDHVVQDFTCPVLWPDIIRQIGSVRRGPKESIVPRQPQNVGAIVADAIRGCGRDGQDWYRGKLMLEDSQLGIVGPKVVSPLTGAMTFVNDDPTQAILLVQLLQLAL